MKTRELTQIQLIEMAYNCPEWMADNRTKWMLRNLKNVPQKI